MAAARTAFITGAGRGIGRAIAEELARAGWNVALVARTQQQVDEVADAVNGRYAGRALALRVDVRDRSAVTDAVAQSEADLGPIDLLVNNAGTGGPAGPEWEVDPEAWWECIESIVRGAFTCTQAVMPGMLARGAGRVVDIASITGTSAWPLVTATSLAKTALIRRVEGLAAACADSGVTVFALHPGMVRTELLMGYASHPAMAAFLDAAPPEAFSPPELAASVIARIASGDFDQLSGCFLDATTDLDELKTRAAEMTDTTLKLRLVPV